MKQATMLGRCLQRCCPAPGQGATESASSAYAELRDRVDRDRIERFVDYNCFARMLDGKHIRHQYDSDALLEYAMGRHEQSNIRLRMLFGAEHGEFGRSSGPL